MTPLYLEHVSNHALFRLPFADVCVLAGSTSFKVSQSFTGIRNLLTAF